MAYLLIFVLYCLQASHITGRVLTLSEKYSYNKKVARLVFIYLFLTLPFSLSYESVQNYFINPEVRESPTQND